MTIDLEKMVQQPEENSAETLPQEMMDDDFLDSPIGRIMQALAGLEVAVQAFNARIDHLEQHLMYLLSKDTVMGPKVAAMIAATKEKKAVENGDIK